MLAIREVVLCIPKGMNLVAVVTNPAVVVMRKVILKILCDVILIGWKKGEIRILEELCKIHRLLHKLAKEIEELSSSTSSCSNSSSNCNNSSSLSSSSSSSTSSSGNSLSFFLVVQVVTQAVA